MRIFILDKEKITKFNLPEKIAGAFAIDYLPINSKIKRTISVEAKDNNWIVKSNSSINVMSADTPIEEAILQEHCYQPIQVKGRKDTIGIYCVPSVEPTYNKYTIHDGNKILIGSGNNTSIGYIHNNVLKNHITIEKKESGYFISAQDDENKFAYLNDKRITNTKLKAGDVIF